jgi:hypothetical protein
MSAAQNPGTPREIARFFLGLASGRLLVLLVVLALGARLAAGRFALADGLVAGGVLAAWPFIEWLVHVFWLHLDPVELPRWRVGRVTLGGRFDPYVARKHRAHHRDPWRLDHVMIPLHTYLYSVPLNLLFWFGLFEPPQALTGLTMVSALGLHYEVVHLLAHSRYRPRSRLYRRLWRNHRLHHCKSEKHWLGVTMLLGDRVLGTSGDPRAVPTSPTCRTLGQEETLGA